MLERRRRRRRRRRKKKKRRFSMRRGDFVVIGPGWGEIVLSRLGGLCQPTKGTPGLTLFFALLRIDTPYCWW
jgi:hypothetical protein